MTRFPWFSSLIVLVAAAIMVGLGLWQLERAEQKERVLARLSANLQAAPLVLDWSIDLDRDLFRRASVRCEPAATTIEGAGRYGFRVLADCRTLGEGQRLRVQLGTSRQLIAPGRWPGGPVTGWLTEAPDSRTLLVQAFQPRPATPLLVADPPVLPGSPRPPRPTTSDIPNNHRSYAFQWFSFATLAIVIFGLALRRRRGRA